MSRQEISTDEWISNRHTSRRRLMACAAAALAAGGGVVATGAAAAASSSSSPSGTVSLVAYSTPEPAYLQLVDKFQQTTAGKNVKFSYSFGPSGTESRNVAAGQPADVVNFSLATDMERLVKDKLVSSSWNSNTTTRGMVTDSVVVFVVPKGNPEHITSWQDLVKPGVRIFTPNPFSSGSARWNLMAAYGAELKQGKSTSQAQSFLQSILSKTVAQSASAADELQAFVQDGNKHDVLLDYEDDAIQAQRSKVALSYVIPPQSLLIENPIAVTTNSKNAAAAKAFVTYLLSPAGQTEWAQLGYRSVRPAVEAKFRTKFPDPKGLFTIQYVGGWDSIATKFFGATSGIVTQIEQHLGVSTSSS
ncbi:MAG: sulfate transporter, periplasmic sulfate-binding protein [Acidimicrobiaceae bacterium]|nr:sulfate transporter, periplasmic sulfate-binding protein [Acidimicrobiaceae bacterium]